MLKYFKKIKQIFHGKSGKILASTYSIPIKSFEKIVGFSISNSSIYIKALTHRSALESFPELTKSNERLEFLGDSVLGLLVAEFLFKNYNTASEGFLTKYRSQFVNRLALAEAAERMHLEQMILFNKKYIRGDNEEGIKSILADTVEAVIGAIYLDKGLSHASKFVDSWIIQPNISSGKYKIDSNYKGQLLEFTHIAKMADPEYVLIKEEGPDHKKTFSVQVKINEDLFGVGKGRNKKSAEQNAAEKTLQFLKKNNCC